MKTLQNNFTTPKQSKRLLELGLPADSADFFYDLDADNPPHANNTPWYLDIPYSELIKEFNLRDFLPCWSVGRLQQIFAICFTGEPFKMWYDSNFFIPENVVDGIEEHREELDFSKLKEYEN